ncbi:ERP29 [Symbiodinium natans]|uniref:ERP29 protein n=1 Tax=Symbiodinium natans TaxID=878477 RepID=A0A812V6C4_9DINO|nr:ERP29 [Symbiodinium natans]
MRLPARILCSSRGVQIARSTMAVRFSILALLAAAARAADYNVVNLDNSTLKMLTGKDIPAFVRFDKDYPYGEKADAFKALAQTAVGAKVLIGSVGISTYGEKMNQDLAEEFGYKTPGKDLEYSDMDTMFPKFRLFPANGGADIEYTGEVATDAMTLFLKKEAKIYFGLKGTIREFDKFAADFVKAGADKADVIKTAKSAAEALSGADKDAASYYVKAMEKTQDKSEWFKTEFERLKQIIAGGKVAPAKKEDMALKVNRLSSFVSPNDEL